MIQHIRATTQCKNVCTFGMHTNWSTSWSFSLGFIGSTLVLLIRWTCFICVPTRKGTGALNSQSEQRYLKVPWTLTCSIYEDVYLKSLLQWTHVNICELRARSQTPRCSFNSKESCTPWSQPKHHHRISLMVIIA